VLLTLLLVVTQLTSGSVRIVMLEQFSTDQYLLWSRVLGWSLNGALALLAFRLIARAMANGVSHQVEEG
jgi:hypothetical protein